MAISGDGEARVFPTILIRVKQNTDEQSN